MKWNVNKEEDLISKNDGKYENNLKSVSRDIPLVNFVPNIDHKSSIWINSGTSKYVWGPNLNKLFFSSLFHNLFFFKKLYIYNIRFVLFSNDI